MVKIGLLLIILALIAGIGWQLRSGRRRRTRTRIPPTQAIPYGPPGQLETLRRNRNYWGVEIRSGICKASKTLAGRQFPFHEAPTLPLAECAVSCCTCSYLGLRERRMRHRRAQPDRRQMIRYLKHQPDRRCNKERRQIDIWGRLKL
jgi:hypothetical protein